MKVETKDPQQVPRRCDEPDTDGHEDALLTYWYMRRGNKTSN